MGQLLVQADWNALTHVIRTIEARQRPRCWHREAFEFKKETTFVIGNWRRCRQWQRAFEASGRCTHNLRRLEQQLFAQLSASTELSTWCASQTCRAKRRANHVGLV